MSWLGDIRKQARHRFLVDIIQDVNNRYKGAGTILVLDEASAKIISDIVSLAELTENGIFVVENIQKQRKNYPTFRAIYFLVPDRTNFDAIDMDFGTKENKYANVHIFFTKRLSDADFGYLKSKNFSKKAKTVKEVNMHVKLTNDCIIEPFDTNVKMDTHLDTLTAALSYIPGIDSIEVFKLANPIYKEADSIYKDMESRVKDMMTYIPQNGENSVKLFIFERSADLVTPLIHDFHYESLIVDILESNKLSNGSPDFVMRKYRHKFIRDCMLGVGADFEKFLNENPIAKIQRNKDNKDVDIDKMGIVVRGITEYNEIIKTYETHLDYVKKLDTEIGKRGTNELADLELTIVTGIDNYGDNIESTKRTDIALKHLNTLNSRTLDQTRLLMIMQGSLYKDLSSKSGTLSDPKLRESFQKYIQLVEKYGKYWPEKDKETLKKITKEKYKIAESPLQRYTCKTEYLVSDVLKNGRVSQFDSYRHGEIKTGFSKAPNTLFKGKLHLAKNKTNGQNFVIIYFIGGISYAEIQSLKNLESSLGDSWTFIFGGNGILNPKEFINRLSTIAVNNKPNGIIEF